ncbi:unnamed protein product [Adineta steineri]|uniref:BTB domain-containing protein n=3 Tax=Adineta steineri TaxID=433720 RepID=A0A818YR11_9BILA|nr:unnamed protein product [Adineta steineri]CAF3756315.1 unnamed protein product [Adineta steineri]
MSSSEESDSSSYFEDIDTESEDEENIAQTTSVPNEQWVKLIEFCSYKAKSEDSIRRNIGVEKLCQATDVNFGDKHKVRDGWILHNNNCEEVLVVSFLKSIFINEIHIYESLNPGSITKIEMLESIPNRWWTMWQRKTSPKQQSLTHNIFKPLLRRYRILSNTIRLTIDPKYTDQIGIHAIKLLGSDVFDVTLHYKPLIQSMKELYEQALNKINTDVQFTFNDKIICAHRNILCCRSTYFHSLLLDNFIEKSQQKPIELTDVDYETFLEILFFIYTGAYHQTISYDIAIKAMIYSNKINLLTATNLAIEYVCHYLQTNHDFILPVYYSVKKMSPEFDSLLNYIYDLCSEHLSAICKQTDFIELDKELMIDLIYHSTERRDIREKEKNKELTSLHVNFHDNDNDDDDEDDD